MPGPGIELIGAEETAEVLEVLQSGYLSRYGPSDDPRFGAKVHHIEEAIAEAGRSPLRAWPPWRRVGRALDRPPWPGRRARGRGDRARFTYVASISAIVYTGATPILAEIDQTFDLDPVDVEAKITPRTAAILVVHMLGAPARINELKAIADRHGIPLVEDCAQAFGATYEGRGVGGFGAAGTFSFNEFKTITCGDGGMIVTDDEALYERCFAMHDQGHAPDRLESKYAPRPFLGMNFRMTELSGAVLLAQVRKLDLITSHSRANKAIVKDMLEEVPTIGFRSLTDPDGDLATHLVVVLPSKEIARNVAEEVGAKTPLRVGLAHLQQDEPPAREADRDRQGLPIRLRRPRPPARGVPGRHAAPTDDLLERSLSIGIGVRDPNLAPFGLRMRDGEAEARQVGATFRDAVIKHRA